MTTVAELKRDETKRKTFLLDALQAANTLDKAEREMIDFSKTFKRASTAITDLTGWELWHTDADDGKFYWVKWTDESIKYPNRSAAIRALLDDAIELKK